VVGSTVGEESGSAFAVSSDDVPSSDAARFCFRWIRRAALSLCRSSRRISFWRLLKVSISLITAPAGTATFAQSRRYTLPAGLPSLTPASLGAARESAAATFSLRTRLVEVERATFQIGAIQSRNCPGPPRPNPSSRQKRSRANARCLGPSPRSHDPLFRTARKALSPTTR